MISLLFSSGLLSLKYWYHGVSKRVSFGFSFFKMVKLLTGTESCVFRIYIKCELDRRLSFIWTNAIYRGNSLTSFHTLFQLIPNDLTTFFCIFFLNRHSTLCQIRVTSKSRAFQLLWHIQLRGMRLYLQYWVLYSSFIFGTVPYSLTSPPR